MDPKIQAFLDTTTIRADLLRTQRLFRSPDKREPAYAARDVDEWIDQLIVEAERLEEFLDSLSLADQDLEDRKQQELVRIGEVFARAQASAENLVAQARAEAARLLQQAQQDAAQIRQEAAAQWEEAQQRSAAEAAARMQEAEAKEREVERRIAEMVTQAGAVRTSIRASLEAVLRALDEHELQIPTRVVGTSGSEPPHHDLEPLLSGMENPSSEKPDAPSLNSSITTETSSVVEPVSDGPVTASTPSTSDSFGGGRTDDLEAAVNELAAAVGAQPPFPVQGTETPSASG